MYFWAARAKAREELEGTDEQGDRRNEHMRERRDRRCVNDASNADVDDRPSVKENGEKSERKDRDADRGGRHNGETKTGEPSSHCRFLASFPDGRTLVYCIQPLMVT
jgi:hypothetical protein